MHLTGNAVLSSVTAANARGRRLAALIARQRAGADPRPRELADLRRTMRELEHRVAQIRWRREVAETIHDALAERIAEREARLGREWRRLVHRPEVRDVVVTEESVVIDLVATEQDHCRFVHLRPDAPVRIIARNEEEIDPSPELRRLLARHLEADHLGDLLDRLTGVRACTPRDSASPFTTSRPNDAEVFVVLLRPWLSRLDEARAEVMAIHADSDRLERDWRAAVRRAATLSSEIERHPHPESVMTEEDLTIFERVLALPGVADAGVVDDALLVDTDPIDITEYGEQYRLGRFRLRLHVPSWHVEVRAEAMHNPYGIDHPHVSRGIPCFGSHAGYVRSLWQRTDLAGLVRLLLVFLGSYNAAGAYLPISSWPLARAGVEEVTE